jgi:hypothetical protein
LLNAKAYGMDVFYIVGVVATMIMRYVITNFLCMKKKCFWAGKKDYE